MALTTHMSILLWDLEESEDNDEDDDDVDDTVFLGQTASPCLGQDIDLGT